MYGITVLDSLAGGGGRGNSHSKPGDNLCDPVGENRWDAVGVVEAVARFGKWRSVSEVPSLILKYHIPTDCQNKQKTTCGSCYLSR